MEFDTDPTKKEKITDFLKEKTTSFANIFKSSDSDINKTVNEKTLTTTKNINNFDLNQAINNFFAPEMRNKIHKFFVIISILTIGYFSGKIIALSIQSVVKTSGEVNISNNNIKLNSHSYISSVQAIKDSNLFNTKSDALASIPQKNTNSKNYEIDKLCGSASKQSSTPFTILSTIVLQNSLKSLVTLEVRGKKEILYLREGNTHSSQIRIDKIERNKVILKNLKDGSCEYLINKKVKLNNKISNYQILSPKAGKKLIDSKFDTGIQQEGNVFNIKKSFRDNMLKDISSILTQAKAIPIKNPDGTTFYKITQVVPGSLFSTLNIQNEDIIESVNGKKFKNLNEVMKMFSQLKSLEHVEITKRRSGVTTTQEYNFE